MSEIYQGLRNDSNAIGENNDCGVKALAVITGESYNDCHAILKKLGRKNGRGTWNSQIQRALDHFGFEMVKVDCPYNGLRSLGRNLPSKGSFLIWATRHFAGARDGKIHDWSEGRCLRLKMLWQIVKKDSNEPIHEFQNEKPSNRTRRTTLLYNLTHPEMGVIAHYKRFPNRVDRTIKLNGYLVINKRHYRAGDFKIEKV